MIYEIMSVLLVIVAILTIFIVSIQRSYGGFFGGQSANDSTIIFGGSGGSEILQKITWILGFILIFGTLFLAIYKTNLAQKGNIIVVKNEKPSPEKQSETKENAKEESQHAQMQNNVREEI